MKRPDDETLMAYADGLLDANERAQIAAHLETDPEARETVAMFQGTAALVEGFGDEAYSTPVADHLIAMLREGAPAATSAAAQVAKPATLAEASPAAAKTAKIIPMRAARRSVWPTSAPEYAALAACLALVAGATIGWFARSVGEAGDKSVALAVGPVSAGTPLVTVLEQRASYDPLALPAVAGEPAALVVMSTFRDRDKRFCREFELTLGTDQRPVNVGVACRNERGRWTVEGVVKTAVAANASPDKIKPAGVQEGAALDGFMTMLGAGPALSKDDEKAIIGKGWK